MKQPTRRRGLALLLTLMLLLSLLPTAAFAAGNNTIYTDMNYKGVSDGTENKPYANFEDAIANASDGDTIVIKGKAYANVKEEAGTTPLIIDKRVTVTGEGDAVGQLYVRAGGIMLGADVTFRNVELNLANKYHNAIFANGYHFTAESVTRGSGSREVHLFAGGIGTDTQVTSAMPAVGSSAVLTLTNSTFGSIYAGGVADGFAGDVTVTATGSTLGAVYGSGAAERAPDGNWFDTTEPPAPTAEEQYAVTGAVSITTDGSSATEVDAMSHDAVSVTVNNAEEHRPLSLFGVKSLTVNGGTAAVQTLTIGADVTTDGTATLDISGWVASTLSSLSGGGKLILAKDQTLSIEGGFNGDWAFETANGFNGKSGVAEYDHNYITFRSGSAAVTFAPHDTQSTMTLAVSGNNWTTSAAPETLPYVTTFTVVEDSITVTKTEVNAAGAELNVDWMNPGQIPQLTVIPLRYDITYNGQTYYVYATADQDGFYSARFAEAHMLISANDTQEDGKSLLMIESDGTAIEAGVYQFSVFAPDADGGEIRQNFSLIITDDSAAQTPTTVTVTVQDVHFGDALQPNIEVKAGETVLPDAEVEYYINGWKADPSQLVAQTFHNIKLGTNELRVVYKGSDTYEPSVGTAAFQVAKATNTKVIAALAASSGKAFDGKAFESTLTGTSAVRTNDGNETVLDTDAKVSIAYRKDDQTVKEAVFPGTYTIVLVVAEGEMYEAFEMEERTITIRKAKPTVVVDAADKGNGVVELTAAVEGVAPYTPTGKISFLWGKETLVADLVNGKASYTVNDAEPASLYTYKATYVPAADEPYHDGAVSEEKTITTGAAPLGTVTADLFNFTAPTLTYDGHDQTDAVKAAVSLKDGLTGKVGEITAIIKQADTEITALNAGAYDVYVTAAEGSEYEALTQPLKLGSVTIDPKTITAADFAQGENPVYNGAEQAAPITAKDLVTGQDYDLTGTAALTDVAAADVTVTAAGKGNYDGTVDFTWNLKKAKPTGDPSYTAITGSGKTLADAKLALGAIQPAGGTIRWVLAENTAVQANTRYEWEYIPPDETNYEKLTGSIELWHQEQGGSTGGGTVTPATYPVTAAKAENGAVSVSPARASRGETVTVTVTPDESFVLKSLTVRDGRGNEIAAAKTADNKYTFTMPAGAVTVSAEFEAEAQPIQFSDVKESDWYYDAVQWAVRNGITTGTGNDRFSPNGLGSRAEVVTFLWRAAGSPEPTITAHSFTDIDPSAYYYKAVLWAIEQGITVGTGKTTFSPDVTVSRGQTVTFLYRAAGSPAVSGTSFGDVPAGAYFASAAAWAAQMGITSGTGNGNFSPQANCTRAQIVTFLFRQYGK